MHVPITKWIVTWNSEFHLLLSRWMEILPHFPQNRKCTYLIFRDGFKFTMPIFQGIRTKWKGRRWREWIERNKRWERKRNSTYFIVGSYIGSTISAKTRQVSMRWLPFALSESLLICDRHHDLICGPVQSLFYFRSLHEVNLIVWVCLDTLILTLIHMCWVVVGCKLV